MRRTTRSELFTGRVYGFVPESVLSCDREDPTELALFAAFFAMLGLCVLVIGAHDFSISSASFGLTLVSLALVAFGIILVVAVQHLAALALGWGCDSQTTTLPECKTRVLVACGSTYSLTGSRVVACHRQPTPEKLQQFFAKFNVDPARSRFMTDAGEVQPAALLAAGKFVGDGKRVDVNVPVTRQLVFFVPHDRYQLLRLRAQLFAISATVPLSRSGLPAYLSIARDHDEYGFWRVDDYSWLHSLIYGRRRWVVLRYELAAEPTNPNVSPDLRVTARFLQPTWSESPPSSSRVQTAFAEAQPTDSSEPFADAELALAPVAPATAKDNCPGGPVR
jgi:hypothetical protein